MSFTVQEARAAFIHIAAKAQPRFTLAVSEKTHSKGTCPEQRVDETPAT